MRSSARWLYSVVARGFARLRSLHRGVWRRSRVEEEMLEEFGHHIELRTEDLVRSGLSRAEASRRAHREFGHVGTHRAKARSARGLALLDELRFSWIDLKLGLRMLVARPALTLVAMFALAVGIPVGMAPMHVANAVEAPLPEDPQDRIRAFRYWDPATQSVTLTTRYELDRLRSESSSFEALGATRTFSYGVSSERGRAAPVDGAQVTASTFSILGVVPLIGRVLDESDEELGAENVVVLGHDVWRARFAADPTITGRTVRVAGVPHTVIGVMPPGFLFPSHQQMWVPLRDPPQSAPGEGAGMLMFGRLADGVTWREAEAEVELLGATEAETVAPARARLQLQVVPLPLAFMSLPRGGLDATPEFYVFQLLALVLLLVACVNVAILVFARTATRFREIAVRTALGASRTRIVSQMFVETMTLATISAGIGVLGIHWIIGRVDLGTFLGEVTIPYWLSLQATAESAIWAIVLAVGSATVAGVGPALWITRGDIQRRIQRSEAGRSGIRFGGATSALIVADVAAAIVVVGLAVSLSRHLTDVGRMRALTGVAAEEYLSAELRLPVMELSGDLDVDGRAFRGRVRDVHLELAGRLRAEPGVRAVAIADALPRMDHRARIVSIDGVEPPEDRVGTYVRAARVDVGFFEALDGPLVAGRDFELADIERELRPVIVNTVLVDRLLGGLDPLGRRLRFHQPGDTSDDVPWHEIVGVVGHLGMNVAGDDGAPGLYLPVRAGELHPLRVGLHIGASPESFIPRLREIVAEVDPDLIVERPVSLDRVFQGDWYLMAAITGGLALLVLILVALAASGIYAIISFSVAERTREIGIRTALGASKPALVITILGRSLIQLLLGAALGAPLAAWVLNATASSSGSPAAEGSLTAALLIGIATVSVVGLLSCVAPARAALEVEPTDALRGEG